MHLNQRVTLAERRIVLDCTRTRGGVAHTSEKTAESRNGEAVETVARVTRHVDHERACTRVDAARRRVTSTIKKYCKSSPLGWLIPEERVAAFETELQDAYAACHDANQYAEAEGSARRVAPSITYAHADWSDPAVIRHVYEALAERVQEQLTALVALPVDRLTEVRQELLLIATMVAGPARAALEVAAREVAGIAGDRRAGREPDLSVVEAAAEWFR